VTLPKDVSVSAGTLGRIEKRAGTRSEPLWVVELLPNSAPQPFWRSLMHPMGETRALMSNVVLASSQIAEINDFFDRYGIEWTRFGEDRVPLTESDPDTTRLPQIYARPKLSLAENVATAHEAGALDSIQAAALGLVLVPKDSQRSRAAARSYWTSPFAVLARPTFFAGNASSVWTALIQDSRLQNFQ